jgi:hypothetical protein
MAVFERYAFSGKMRYSDYSAMLLPDDVDERATNTSARGTDRLTMDAKNSLRRVFQAIFDSETRTEAMRVEVTCNDHVKPIFEELDTNQAGYVTENDMKRAAPGVEYRDLRQLFSRFGKDSGKLSYQDFSDIWAPRSSSRTGFRAN